MLYAMFMMGARVTLDLVLLITHQPEIGIRLMVALCARGNQIVLALTSGDAALWPDAETSYYLIRDCPILTTPDFVLLRAHHSGTQEAPLPGVKSTFLSLVLRRVVKEHMNAAAPLVASPAVRRQKVVFLIFPKEHS
jgi:hypothetical protein